MLKNLKRYFSLAAFITMISLMILLLIVTFLQVAIRNLPLPKFPWTEEIARFANVWIAFLGSAVLLDNHISVSFLMRYIPYKLHYYIEILINIPIMAFYAITFWGGINMMVTQGNLKAPTTGITMFWFYLPVIICCLILTILHAVKILLLGYKGG
ncbi:MAG: hypothetical protein PWQ70_3215 [Clostridiales bacterium]|nr:hypothetical protein [Clostridiales bacterium]